MTPGYADFEIKIPPGKIGKTPSPAAGFLKTDIETALLRAGIDVVHSDTGKNFIDFSIHTSVEVIEAQASIISTVLQEFDLTLARVRFYEKGSMH